MTDRTGGLDIEVVQRAPCRVHAGACMTVVIGVGGPLEPSTTHICDDDRAIAARAVCARLAAVARAAGYCGAITIHFPPGTFGAHSADSSGRLVPVRSGPPRPGR